MQASRRLQSDPHRERLEHHYRVEKELATRLKNAPAEERARTYCEVYDELFRQVPDHPQLSVDPAERARHASERLRFIRRFFGGDDVAILEIGAGDCVFSSLAAREAARVIAVDVAEEVVRRDSLPPNVELYLIDGVTFPIPDETVDVAFSDQLLEHLHPDDVEAQLRDVRRVLRPGGRYVCITPNRTTGPHDVSGLFSDVAEGFHLKEYDSADIKAAFHEAGFRRIDFYVGGKGRYLRIPAPLLALMESFYRRLPRRVRRLSRAGGLDYAFLGLNVVARA